jgi:hypothetical protein
MHKYQWQQYFPRIFFCLTVVKIVSIVTLGPVGRIKNLNDPDPTLQNIIPTYLHEEFKNEMGHICTYTHTYIQRNSA